MKRLKIILAFAGSVCVVFWPILSGRYVFSTDWAQLQMYPAIAVMADSLQHYSQLPLWVSSYGSGHAPYVTHGYAYLQPVALFFSAFLDSQLAYHLTVCSYILAAIICLFLLATHLKLSFAASIIAAVTYGFSQYAFFFAHSDAPAYAIIFPPLVFLLIFRIHGRTGNTINMIALGAIVTALMLYGALPDTIFYALLAGLGLSVYLDSNPQNKQENGGTIKQEQPADRGNKYVGSKRPSGIFTYFLTRWRVTMAFLILCFIGFVLAAPIIFITLRYIDFSARANPASTWDSISGGLSLSDLPLLIYPDFFPGIPYVRHPLTLVYVGTIALFLGLWGIAHRRSHRFGSVVFWIFGVSFITTVAYSPLYYLLKLIPPFNKLNYSFKLLPVLLTCFAILAGIGFDRLGESSKEKIFRRYVQVWQWLCGLILAGAVLFYVIWHTRIIGKFADFFVHYLAGKRGGNEMHYRDVFEFFAKRIGENLSLGNLRFVLALVFLAATAVIATLWLQGKFAHQKLRTITIAGVICNMLLIWQGSAWFTRSDVLAMPPTLAAIADREDPDPFRIAFAIPDSHIASRDDLATPAEDHERLKLAHAFGMRNSPGMFGLEGVDGDDPFLPRRYKRLLEELGPSDYFRQTAEFAALSMEEKTRLVSSRTGLFAMLNVRYLITTYELAAPWNKISDFNISGQTVALYQNPAFLPRAYFPETITNLPLDEKGNFNLLIQNADFGKSSFIECLPDCPEKNRSDTSIPPTVHLVRETARTYSIEVETNDPRWLVVSESNTPYWRVRMDGNPVSLYTANYIYKGVLIPAGKHSVSFEYPGLLAQGWYAFKDFFAKPAPYAPYIL